MKAKQFGVNTNFATTYHKMQVRLGRRWIWYFLMSHKSMATQGVTADKLVVSSWNYSLKNGVYIVLSRVTRLSGLFAASHLARIRTLKSMRI